MVLTAIDFLNGLFSLIFVSVTIIVGLKIASKYFKIKNRVFLLVGLGWAGICSAWYPSSISFLLVLITGKGLEPAMYFFVGNVILHFSITLYLIGITDMIYKEKQKYILGFFIIVGIIYNIYFYYYLFTDPSVIGELEGYFDVTYVRIVSIYLIFDMAMILIFTIALALQSLKSDEPEVKWKGKILIPAALCYLLGALFDSSLTLTEITLIITRFILISSSILFYLAYMMPEVIKKRIVKED